MVKAVIKVGMLVSYDYQYIYTSLPLIYDHADEITIAIDRQRKSWSGKTFAFDETVPDWIRSMDVKSKIRIYEDDFYKEGLSTMENDTRERNMVAAFMGRGGWHVQVDTDEFFYNFGDFAKWLRRHYHYLENPEKNPVDIAAWWLTLYKKTDDGFLYISNSYESFPLATNLPVYKYSRQCGYAWRHVNFYVLHQSWARDVSEIETKINNWSHSADFDVQQYFQFWKNVNASNYRQFKNFHPVNGPIWKQLGYEPGKTIPEFAANFQRRHKLRIPWHIFFRRWWKEWKRRVKGK